MLTRILLPSLSLIIFTAASPAQARECRTEEEILRAAKSVAKGLESTLETEKPAPAPTAATRRSKRRRRGMQPGPELGFEQVEARLRVASSHQGRGSAVQQAWEDLFIAMRDLDANTCRLSKRGKGKLAEVVGKLARIPDVPVFELVAVEQLLRYASGDGEGSWDPYLK